MGNDQSVDSKGTELEQIQEEQAVQDDIFSETFDTAEKLGDDQGDPKVDDLEKEAKSDAAQSGQPDQQKADDDSGKQADKQADASARKQSADASAAKDNEETYEQRWKSLQGILKSKDEKYESERTQLLTELEGLKKTVANLSTDNKDTKDKKKGTDKSDSLFDDLTDEQKAELSEYEKDFDSVSKMEGLKRERALKKLEDRILERLEERTTALQEKIDSRVQPIEETFKKTDEATHFKTIRESHSDFETHRDSGAILKWIETKPRYLRESMKATYEQGTAEDVVDLISDFKTENNLLESNQNNQSRSDNLIDMDKKKAEKKQNLTAVITKRGSVDAGQGRADDFDSAYNEALKK
jgi:hypothetical protein